MRATSTDRICRFETMEPRQLLAADLALGTIAQAEPIELIQATSDEVSGSLGGRVYLSADLNCSQHENALGLEGVTVLLLNETGVVVDSAFTGAEGEYQFSNLLPGIYAVQEVQPAGYFEGNAQIGSGGGQRFNGSLLGEITIGVGDVLVGYDFCEYETDLRNDFDATLGRRIEPHGLSPAEAIRPNVFLELPQSPKPLGEAQMLLMPTTFVAMANTPRQPATLLPLALSLESSVGTQNDIRQLSSSEAEQRTELLDGNSPFSNGPFATGDVRWMLSGFDQQVPEMHDREASVLSDAEPNAGSQQDKLATAHEDAWLSELTAGGPWNPEELWQHFGEEDDLAATGETAAKPFLWLTAELL